MKITDFCLIFIAVVLPIIIVVYINVSFTIKAEEQEMYYEQLINAAIEDATTEMKQIENEDKNIDYGYSGEKDKKVSISADIGVDAFFNSLYNNFGIKGNVAAQRYLQIFIPVVAVMDYNGIYVSSIEEFEVNEAGKQIKVQEHKLKPKKYFSYTYYVLSQKDPDDWLPKVVSAREYDPKQGTVQYSHTVEFTMDDYITHRGAAFYSSSTTYGEMREHSFYLADTSRGSNVVGDVYAAFVNNKCLFNDSSDLSSYDMDVINKIVEHLRSVKDKVIIETVTNEIAFSVNANNYYANDAGVHYDFVFPLIEQERMGEFINDIGVIAFVQGLSIGNRYLDTEAYSVTRLELVNKYYLSVKSEKYEENLYHMSADCPEYKLFLKSKGEKTMMPEFTITKQQATSVVGKFGTEVVRGFYPCPVCNP